jgi:hypothetical protein
MWPCGSIKYSVLFFLFYCVSFCFVSFCFVCFAWFSLICFLFSSFLFLCSLCCFIFFYIFFSFLRSSLCALVDFSASISGLPFFLHNIIINFSLNPSFPPFPSLPFPPFPPSFRSRITDVDGFYFRKTRWQRRCTASE